MRSTPPGASPMSSRPLLVLRSIRQRRQLAGALRDHRGGDPDAGAQGHRRHAWCLGRQHRHRRHPHRRRAAPAASESGPPRHLGHPGDFPGIEGLKPLAHPGDLVAEILDESLIDRRIEVTLDQAVAMSRRLARQGLFVGPLSGACGHAALQAAYDGPRRTRRSHAPGGAEVKLGRRATAR